MQTSLLKQNSLAGTPVGGINTKLNIRRRSNRLKTESIFTSKKKAAEVIQPVAPSKKSFFSFGQKKGDANAKTPAKTPKKETTTSKADLYKKRQGVGGVISAFDFADVRSKNDAELLYDAKYGDLENGRMTKEQYQALRRKIGGTAKDYWKTWIDVKGDYVDKGYVSKESTNVPALPFLIGVVVALFGATFYVVAQTSL